MVWKVINIADTGTASKFGGNDMDKISNLFAGIPDVDQINMNSDFDFRDSKLLISNPADTFSYEIRSSAISAQRDLTLPLITGNDTFAVLGLAQTFSEKITISKDQASMFDIFRLTNTINNSININLDARDSGNNQTTYGRVAAKIIDNTDTSEDGNLEFFVMKAGQLTSAGRFDENGRFQCGGVNKRIQLDESGLTADRIFTFPDTATTLVGLAGNQTISGVKTYTDQAIKLRNPANTFSYTLIHGAITANRNLTVPLITGDDTIATANHSLINPYLGKGSGATLRRQGIWWGNDNVNGDGLFNDSTSSVGTDTDVNDSTEGRGISFDTTAVANANAGIKQTNENFQRDWRSYMILRIKLSSTSDIRGFFGWTSNSTDIAGETTLNNLSGAGLGFRTGDTNWFTYRNDGDATEDRVDTGIAKSTSAVTLEMELDTTSFRSKLNGVTQTAQTTELPAAATLLFLMCQIETGAGAAAKQVQIFPIYVQTGGEVMI